MVATNSTYLDSKLYIITGSLWASNFFFFCLVIIVVLLTVDILVLGIRHVVGVTVVHRILHVELVLLVVRKHVVIVLEHVTPVVLVPLIQEE